MSVHPLITLVLATLTALAARPAPPITAAHPVTLDQAEADSLTRAIRKDRADTEQWLKSGETSYLATVQRVDFGAKKTLTVGRAADNHVCIADPTVSPHHLIVSVTGDSFYVAAVDPGVAFRLKDDVLTNATLAPSSIGIGRFTLRLSHQRFPAIIVFDPQSPHFSRYKGLKWFPVDLSYRYQLRLTANPKPDTVIILSTRGNRRRAVRVGWFDFLVGAMRVPARGDAVAGAGRGRERHLGLLPRRHHRQGDVSDGPLRGPRAAAGRALPARPEPLLQPRLRGLGALQLPDPAEGERAQAADPRGRDGLALPLGGGFVPLLSLVATALLLASPPAAVDSTAAAAAGGPLPTCAGALRVYTNCPDCQTADYEYLRTHITFVDHVRDPQYADVQVLETAQNTGGGGFELTLTFIGQGRFAGMGDTLRCFTRPGDSDEMVRRAFTQVCRLGLVRFAARTPLADGIAVSYAEPSAAAALQAADRWHNWVFTTSLNGWISGQSSTRSLNTWGSITANRILKNDKFTFSVSGSYYENRFDLDDGERILSVSRSRSTNTRYVWGLGEHWSAAARLSAYRSSYSNIELDWGVGPTLEFNAFPYSQSTRRQLRFDYYMTFHRADYELETIFLKTAESLWRQGLDVTLRSTEPWGSCQITLSAFHYVHDFGKNLLSADGSVSLRVLEGLSFKVSGNASRVRDQLSLQAQGATLEEILLQRRQLATQYQYYVSLGLDYTFGSIFSNIVNARCGD